MLICSMFPAAPVRRAHSKRSRGSNRTVYLKKAYAYKQLSREGGRTNRWSETSAVVVTAVEDGGRHFLRRHFHPKGRYLFFYFFLSFFFFCCLLAVENNIEKKKKKKLQMRAAVGLEVRTESLIRRRRSRAAKQGVTHSNATATNKKKEEGDAAQRLK